MTASRALLLPVLALLAARLAAAPAVPRVACRADGHCAVSALPAVARDPEVMDYLKSGLTTTLAISLAARGERGEKLATASRIDVRFDPWDEAFDVVTLARGAAAERKRLASEAELHAWWRGLTLSLRLSAAPRGSARVSVELIPFSEEEQADARHWYANSLRVAPAGGPGAAAVGGVLDALTLTSIKRQGVLRFSWTAVIERVR